MARMRYRLRTLVVAVLLGPPLIAAAAWLVAEVHRGGLRRFVDIADESLWRVVIIGGSGATILLAAISLYCLWSLLRDFLRDR